MDWRKTLLSTALVGGCIWCLGMVQKANSEEKTIPSGSGQSAQSEQRALNRGDGEGVQGGSPNTQRPTQNEN